jgi:hypothetical protein
MAEDVVRGQLPQFPTGPVHVPSQARQGFERCAAAIGAPDILRVSYAVGC